MNVATCDIIQLSAISKERTFNVHVLPRCCMTDEASRVTGFTVRDQTLLLRGRPVETVPLRQALTSFIAFLCSVHRPLLAAHNAKRFDCPVLARVLREFSLEEEFQQAVDGFLDTFLLSKDLLAKTTVRRYSQQYLVSLFLNKSYQAHNALEDVRALQDLYHAWAPDRHLVQRHRFTLQQLHDPLVDLLQSLRASRRVYF
ncbi:protein PML-like [Megalops cyprinoides]|uniref:protein PML-like n=1 Tax=Megalops cyprinoides TaxID=118141 RepID=UPI0018655E7B|nr:protein PML-like [Megalops cyprinoides]